MATAQAVRTSTESVTSGQSLILVRNLMRTAISSVCYLRNLFPEDCFEDRPLAGLTIKSLLSTVPEAKTIVSWLEYGVFEALQKKYLKEIVFGIYLDPKQESTLIESYTFRIAYDGGNVSLGITKQANGDEKDATMPVDREAVRKSTTTMLRTLITLAQTLTDIPNERYIVMKLFYYDHTPADYEPVFFRSATFDEAFNYVSKPLKLEIGSVTTPYHSLGLKIKTSIDNLDRLENFKAQNDEGEEVALIENGEIVKPQENDGETSPEIPEQEAKPEIQESTVIQEEEEPSQEDSTTQEEYNEDRAESEVVPIEEEVHDDVSVQIRKYILSSRCVKIGQIKSAIKTTSPEIRRVLEGLVNLGYLQSSGHGITTKYSFVDKIVPKNEEDAELLGIPLESSRKRGLVVVDSTESQVPSYGDMTKVSIIREPIHQVMAPPTKRARINV
ncbi:hypothetical protein P9112_009196 [Eukaryota sp. TZLM1-RC]